MIILPENSFVKRALFGDMELRHRLDVAATYLPGVLISAFLYDAL